MSFRYAKFLIKLFKRAAALVLDQVKKVMFTHLLFLKIISFYFLFMYVY